MSASPIGKKDLRPMPTALVLEHVRVEGTLHLDPSRPRFSDAWESLLRERRGFIPMTDATLIPHGAPEQQSTMPFVLIDKEDVQAAFPLERIVSEGNGHREANRIALEPVEVALLLNHIRVQGNLHLPAGSGRFSDAWERLLSDHRSFIPLSQARVDAHDGEHEMGDADFVVVEKRDIRAAYPVAERNGHSSARRIPLAALFVRLRLDEMLVAGAVHVPSSRTNFERFSDQWDVLMRDRRAYIPVTDVTIHSRDGARVVGAADFMLLDKREIRAAEPGDDEG